MSKYFELLDRLVAMSAMSARCVRLACFKYEHGVPVSRGSESARRGAVKRKTRRLTRSGVTPDHVGWSYGETISL